MPRQRNIVASISAPSPEKYTKKSVVTQQTFQGGQLHPLNFVKLQLNILNLYVLSSHICNIDPTTKRETHMLMYECVIILFVITSLGSWIRH